MNLLLVFGIGLLRIAQSTMNKKTSAYTDTLMRNLKFGVMFELAAAFFSAVYLLIAGVDGIDLLLVICSVVTGVGFVAELFTALAAMRKAPLVLCSLCALGGAIVVPSIIGIFLFDEPLSVSQWVGVILFFIAAYLLSPSPETKSEKSFSKALPILTINFLINGFLGTIGKYYPVKAINPNPALYACWSYATAALVFVILLVAFRPTLQTEKEPIPKSIVTLAAALGATCASIIFLNTYLSRFIPIVVVSTVPNAVCIAGSLFVGYLLFKEKITPVRLIGALVSMAATVLVIMAI